MQHLAESKDLQPMVRIVNRKEVFEEVRVANARLAYFLLFGK